MRSRFLLTAMTALSVFVFSFETFASGGTMTLSCNYVRTSKAAALPPVSRRFTQDLTEDGNTTTPLMVGKFGEGRSAPRAYVTALHAEVELVLKKGRTTYSTVDLTGDGHANLKVETPAMSYEVFCEILQ